MIEITENKLPRSDLSKHPGCTLINVEPLTNLALVRLLQKRGISIKIVKKLLREATVRDPLLNMRFTTLAFKNEDGGYELINPNYKGFVAPRTFTFKRGTMTQPDHVHFFRDVFDYCTFLTIQNGKHIGDAFILNTHASINQIPPYIKDYSYRTALTWMRNSEAGKLATKNLNKQFKNEIGLKHKALSKLYAGFETFNDWHVYNLQL